MWHCGAIALSSAPQAITLDPVTRDFWVAIGGPNLVRIDEASSHASDFPLVATASALAIDPAGRYLYAILPSADLVTILHIDTGDSLLIAVGDSPLAIAVDAIRHTAYVACEGDSSLYVLTNLALTDTAKCAGVPVSIAIDPYTGAVFASLTNENLLLKLDPVSLDSSYYATGANPHGLEIDAVNGALYIATQGSPSIDILSIDDDSLFTIPLVATPRDLVVNPETKRLFIATSSNHLVVLDTQSYVSLDVSLPDTPGYVAIDALSNRAFVTVPSSHFLIEIAASGDTLIVPMAGSPSDLVVNPVTNKVYVLASQPDQVNVFEAANYSGIRIPAHGGPGPIVINMETHKAYTPNWFTADVTVIDGYTNAASNFKVADGPNCLIVDAISDDVYILCAWANKVVIRRSNGDTLMVPLGDYGHGIEMNPNTGKVYVANRYSRDLTVIDAGSLDTSLVRTGAYPCDVAINLETNRIYVPNRTSWTLTVVDGALLTTEFAKIGPGPTQVRVNPVTNKIFSVDSNKRTVSVIDGETLERTVVPVGTTPRTLSINPNTNTIYVSSYTDGEITVIDGDTYKRKPVRCDKGLFGVRVDPYLDKAYTVTWQYPYAHVIDGNFLSVMRIPVGEEPHGTAYDPVLEKLYISNNAGNSVEVIKLRDKIQPQIVVTIDSLPEDSVYTRTPTITGTAVSLRTPRTYGIMKVLYKIDNLRGPWSEATILDSGSEVSWTLTTQQLLLGRHLVFVAAIDSSASSLSSSSTSALCGMSDMACYEFTCLSPPPAPPQVVETASIETDGPVVAWTSTCGEGGWYEIEIAADCDFQTNVYRNRLLKARSFRIPPDLALHEMLYWRVWAVDYPHGKRSQSSSTYSINISNLVACADRSPVHLTIYPNPTNLPIVFSLSGHGFTFATCTIYDVAGRVVTTMPMLPTRQGVVARWDGAIGNGEKASPGVYYVEVRADSQIIRRKFILLR